MLEHRIVYEEVPGSRTTQETMIEPQRERIAYEELQPGDIIQEGDEWQHESGRWKPFASLDGSCVQVRHTQRARRPYRVSTILEIGNALASAQKAATQLQNERDELRVETQNLLKTITDNADQFADAGKILEQERDELQTALIESRLWQQRKVAEVMEVCKERDEVEAELKRVQEVVRNLYDEPTARQVQDMLRTWATELDWSAGCFDSAAREQIDTIQKTLIAVIERIEAILNQEGGGDE